MSFHLNLRFKFEIIRHPLSRDNAHFHHFFSIQKYQHGQWAWKRLRVALILTSKDKRAIFNGKQAMINLSVRDYWTMMVSVHLGFQFSSSLDCLQLIPLILVALRYIVNCEEWKVGNKKKDFSFQISFFNFFSCERKNKRKIIHDK